MRAGNRIIECESCQRILYFNPENEATIERTNFTTKRRARPKVDSQQAWFYHPAYGEIGEAFLAFVNASTNSTRRVYELHTGRQLGDIVEREGSFRLAFPEDLNGVIRLNGNWDEEEIDGWGAELPMVVLDALTSDLGCGAGGVPALVACGRSGSGVDRTSCGKLAAVGAGTPARVVGAFPCMHCCAPKQVPPPPLRSTVRMTGAK